MSELATNKTDRRIAEELQKGRNLPSNLAKDLDLTRQYVQDRMKRLREHGVVTNVGNGLYELNDEWRAYFASLERPPAHFDLGDVVVEKFGEQGLPHWKDPEYYIVVGTPEQTFGEWCEEHNLRDDIYQTFEAENVPGDKEDIPVVELVSCNAPVDIDDEARNAYEAMGMMFENGWTAMEIADNFKCDYNPPTIGVPASDVEFYRKHPNQEESDDDD